MPKKSSGRKRGIQRGVAKHKIRSQVIEGKEIWEQVLFGVPYSAYFKLGAKCWEITFKGCEKLHLIPFTRNDSGQSVPLEQKQQRLHYIVMAIGCVIGLLKGWITLDAMMKNELNLDVFLCLCLFLITFVSFSISSVAILKPKETMDMLNAWPLLLQYLKDLTDTIPSPVDDLSTSFKVITIFLVTQGIAVAGTGVPLVFSHITVCWFPICKHVGLIPDGLLPTFAWQVIFTPLEYLTNLAPMFSAPFYGTVILITVGVLKIYTDRVRLMKVHDLESRAKVERLYIQLELFNRTFHELLRYMIPPTFIGMSTAITVATFMAIRYTDVPLIIYIVFPYTAFALMFIIFWISYDTVRIVRDSEDILGKLLSSELDFVKGMPKEERIKLIKRAKALKKLEFPMGEFAEFSMNVPINIWEECLNQVLFLLSL